jgi:cob(I)alamin adenosyltransferase
MKALRSGSFVAATIMAAGSIAYSGYTAAHVKDLDRRLQRAETLLQSHGQSLAGTVSAEQIRALEARVRRSELMAPQPPQFVLSETSAMEQRVATVEQQIKPHLEVLPSYVPSN